LLNIFAWNEYTSLVTAAGGAQKEVTIVPPAHTMLWRIRNVSAGGIIASVMSVVDPVDRFNGQWGLYEDRPTKAGWIIIPQPNQISELVFSILSMNLSTFDQPAELVIGVLQTYENAGRATINFCNEPIGVINSLSHENHPKISISVAFSFPLSLDTLAACMKKVPDERTVSIIPVIDRDNHRAGNCKFKVSMMRIC
jgi:hypothetical protein